MGWLPAIVTNPGAVLQNLIRPVADDVCLTLRPFSDAQVNPMFRVQNAAGSVNWLQVLANGDVTTDAGANSERFGSLSLTSGTQATAFGYGANAFGQNATAFGANAVANGDYAMGFGGLADTAYAMALGVNSDAENVSIVIGAGASDTAAGQLVIGSGELSFGAGPPGCPITDAYIGSGVTFPTPAAVTLQNTGGRGANVAGANFIIAGGKSTGSAKGGDVLIRTSPAGGAGSSLNALATLAQLTGDSKIGVFGASPVVRQTGGAATATLVYTATEQGMLQRVYDAMRNYGWLT